MERYPVTLTGRVVRLEPLSERHVPELAVAGTDESIWRYLPYGDMGSEENMGGLVREMLRRQAQGTDLPFAVIHLEGRGDASSPRPGDGRAIGMTRFMDLRPADRGLEIGGTWVGVAYQRTAVNTECKYLLLCHAFEVMGCIRVQFKTDHRNTRSQAAIERLGAVKEGVLRNHMVTADGTIRHSVYYSILDSEWPAVKALLESKLAIAVGHV